MSKKNETKPLKQPAVKSRFVWLITKQALSIDVPRFVAIFGGRKENKCWHYMMSLQQKDMWYHYKMEKQTCF